MVLTGAAFYHKVSNTTQQNVTTEIKRVAQGIQIVCSVTPLSLSELCVDLGLQVPKSSSVPTQMSNNCWCCIRLVYTYMSGYRTACFQINLCVLCIIISVTPSDENYVVRG